MFLYLSPLCVKWRKQYSLFQSVAVLWCWWFWSLLAQNIQVSHTGPHCRDLALAQPATGCTEQVYLGMWRRGWNRMALVSEGFLLPRTHRVERDSLRQNCTLEFSWEAEPLAKAQDAFRVNVSGKSLMGCTCTQPFLPPVAHSASVLTSKHHPEDCSKILQHFWQFMGKSAFYFFCLCGKRFINSEGRCCGLAKKIFIHTWQLILSGANFPWPLLCLYPVSSKQHPWALSSSAKIKGPSAKLYTLFLQLDEKWKYAM